MEAKVDITTFAVCKNSKSSLFSGTQRPLAGKHPHPKSYRTCRRSSYLQFKIMRSTIFQNLSTRTHTTTLNERRKKGLMCPHMQNHLCGNNWIDVRVILVAKNLWKSIPIPLREVIQLLLTLW